MKKSLLFPVALLATLSLFAQPTLQNNVFPNVGDVITISEGDTLIVQGSAGANMNWDFSSLAPLEGTTSIQYQYVTVASTPYAADFPTANIASKTIEDTVTYSYFKKETNELMLIGAASEGFLNIYTNPNSALKTPLNFNGSFQDDYASVLETGDGVQVNLDGSQTITYDAYGTLKTPLGTFNNAIRTKGISSISFASTFSGIDVLSTTNVTSYDWFVPNHAGPLVSISYSSGISETRIPGFDTIITVIPLSKSVSFASTATTGVFNAPATLSGLTISTIGPNPTVDQLTLRFNSETGNQSLRLLITDATGKELQNQSIQAVAGENVQSISVNRLAAGNYFLTLTDGHGVVTRNWIKQ